jgi:hypothetical protein
MFSEKENQFIKQLEQWAQSIGINLDRDPERL